MSDYQLDKNIFADTKIPASPNRSFRYFLYGVVYWIIGLGVIVASVVAGVSWLAFCFGSIIIGILLIIFAPNLIFFPFLFIAVGVEIMKNSKKLIFFGK